MTSLNPQFISPDEAARGVPDLDYIRTPADVRPGEQVYEFREPDVVGAVTEVTDTYVTVDWGFERTKGVPGSRRTRFLAGGLTDGSLVRYTRPRPYKGSRVAGSTRKPWGAEARALYDREGRRCDGAARNCDQRATREVSMVPVDPDGKPTGDPQTFKYCSHHRKGLLKTGRWVLRGFKMLGGQPDPDTGKMRGGVYETDPTQ